MISKFLFRFAVLFLIAITFFIWGLTVYRFKVFPYEVIQPVANELTLFFKESHKSSLKEQLILDHQESYNEFDFRGLEIVDTNFQDDGFLLISRYSKEHSQVIVDLLKISSNELIHRWVPDIPELLELGKSYINKQTNRLTTYRAQHPLMLSDGNLIIGSGEGPLARIDECGKTVWVLDRHFHHSIELDAENNLVVPIVVEWITHDNGLITRDDGIAIVTLDGELLKEYSLSRILEGNSHNGIVYGVGEYETDRFHLNDAQPLNGKSAMEGILLSIRNISTVGLFHPKSSNLEWIKTGPWVNQHDINELGDSRFSILGNDFVRTNKSRGVFLNGYSTIYTYDRSSGSVFTPYNEVFRNHDLHTRGGGRSMILENGDAIVELTENSRIYRVTKSDIRWKYVNSVTDETRGAIHWSRYLDSSIGLEWINGMNCETQ